MIRLGIFTGIAIFGLFGLLPNVHAAPFILDNSPGDGTVTIGVDGFGTFGFAPGGDSSNAIFDPVGAGTPADTTFESSIAIRIVDPNVVARSFLASGQVGGSGGLTNPSVTGTPTSASSSFTFDALSFDLDQVLTPTFTGGSQTGTMLTQTYTITNTGGSKIEFELVRYMDGDLQFDGSVKDGGGRLLSDGLEILFETDSATGGATPTTFVGIIAQGGTNPAANRYEIDNFPGLRARIIAGDPLDDTITGDGADADQFIDAGPGSDVSLALRNTFSLDSGETTTYQTNTIFGSGAPADVSITPIGGQILPINTASLLVYGVISGMSSTFSIFSIIAVCALSLYLTLKRKS